MSRLKIIIAILFCVAVFSQFLKIEIWDSDFWWHIATGKYIVSTGSLPEKDPFSYTSELEENKNLFPERENFILKQYWLSQIIFYILYEHTGPKGIILFRSALFTLTILLVFWRLQRWSVSLPVSFLSAFALFMLIMSRLTGDRPVLFTILFTALTFFILEDFKDKKDKRIFLLSPLMLLWSNLHGGFILGVIIIMVFMLGEGIKILSKKSNYGRREIILFYVATGLSLFFSFINPTGWDAFAIAFSSKYKFFTEGVQEYDSPFLVYYKERFSDINYWQVSLAVLFPLILAIRNKKIDLTHVMLLLGLFIAGLTAIRFVIYYGIIAAMIMGREFDAWVKDIFTRRFSEERYIKLQNLLAVAAFCSLLLYMAGFYNLKDYKIKGRGFSIPEKAVDFIESNKLKDNIFNDFGYGGYVSWRLYPWKKTFIDTRALNLTAMNEYSWMVTALDSIYRKEPSPKGPLWERLLNHYNINIVFLSFHDVHGTVHPIIFKLAGSDKWMPVYCDPMGIIFVRNITQNKEVIERYIISKDDIYNAIIYRIAILAIGNRANPRPLISLGETFYKMGRLEDSLTAYRYALKRLPSPQIEEKIKMIESELKSKEKKEI